MFAPLQNVYNHNQQLLPCLYGIVRTLLVLSFTAIPVFFFHLYELFFSVTLFSSISDDLLGVKTYIAHHLFVDSINKEIIHYIHDSEQHPLDDLSLNFFIWLKEITSITNKSCLTYMEMFISCLFHPSLFVLHRLSPY